MTLKIDNGNAKKFVKRSISIIIIITDSYFKSNFRSIKNCLPFDLFNIG